MQCHRRAQGVLSQGPPSNGMIPGLNNARLVRLIRAAIDRCELDLNGATVLTEAASGAYVVTPVIAAMAGAEQVYAFTRNSRHGTVEEVTETTMRLAEAAKCEDQINVLTQLTPEHIHAADIVTNSGHVRPIDARFVEQMKSSAVIPLMY